VRWHIARIRNYRCQAGEALVTDRVRPRFNVVFGVTALIMSTLVNSNAPAPNNGFSLLLALALSFWLWPFFQYFVLEIALVYRHDLKLGGALLYFLACLLSIVAAIVLSVVFISEMRRPRAPVKPGKVVFSILAFDAVGSLLVTGFFVVMEMFCRVGDCPSPN
jgi:hypothetical protein